ncbi:MAG: tRNA uridine-5-carboxymethylaminomethyl(34) synthesis GTPase MnmE [Syntrophobacteraceae bacterium]|nr:tRNA uridine-5-carboxymethylaminomethyl(34) synthesis GTPase MnmE [Syntrophobacteraceae bacterium]
MMETGFVYDTICAISTPIGEGGIGIVRISGAHAFSIARKLFEPSQPQRFPESHRLHHGWIRDPAVGSLVDEVLLSTMRGPHTYTREDVVEINCHSGFSVLNTILEMVLHEGARLAEPGEFTRRAFLNGRIDLSQAEAVIDIIRSRSEKSLVAAGRQLRGEFRRRVECMREIILQIQSELEAFIDFSDDLGDEPAETSLLISRLTSELIEPLFRFIAQFESSRLVREGLSLVLVGKPNVGKSSLLNALLGKDRAIVTPHPGTTRDVIEDTFVLSGILVRVLDTAGIRNEPDEVESMGIEKTLRSVEDGDAVLWLIDQSRPLSEEDDAVFLALTASRWVILMNKSDLPPAVSVEAVRQRYGSEAHILRLSVLHEEDVERLRGFLIDTFLRQPLADAHSMILPNLRHKVCLDQALKGLERAKDLLLSESSGELVCLELQEARRHMEAILGLACDDALLDAVFSQFCVGK